MKEGKLPSELLRSLVFNNIKYKNEDVILRPEIGEDCAAVRFGEQACVLSTDPITGAEKGAGRLAVHISCNDVASSGVRPMAIMITIMAPVSAKEEDIERIMKEASEAAAELGVEIIGGHTEITSAVNKIVISTTALGKIHKDKIVKSKGAKLGDQVIMTKWAGLEGTSILASDRAEELSEVLGTEKLKEAQNFIQSISVVKEGVLAAEFGVSSMHDVTEGGIMGAAWEIAESSNKGIEIFLETIPVHPVTKKICEVFEIDPYRLISSGCMLITTDRGDELVRMLENFGVKATVIGRITDGGKYIVQSGKKIELEPPGADELFSVI